MTTTDRFLFIIFHLIIGIFFFGCATSGTKKISGTAVSIDTKAQIKDLRKDSSHNVKIEIIRVDNQAIRMEVSALFGYRIASVVMTPSRIQYALHTSKKYADGPFTSKTFFPVFRQNLDPIIFWSVIHGRTPKTSDLNCKSDEQSRPMSCVSSSTGAVVHWSYEDDVRRRIEIKNQHFEITWIFKDQTNLDTVQNETFVLKKPADYEEIPAK